MSFEIQQEVAIRVSNLSKCYQIYDKPNDRLKQFVVPKILRVLGRYSKPYFREFWALKDISFEIKKGETVGIIGRNGAGKSTLLQMICGTLSPTNGSIETNGRIAALLELGAGFNSEFTGRENVYLNGCVLGISKEAIDERFAEIAAFADIGQFIDQPVKTYSSGMYVRLAFAVQACVEPDILIVDEALAVGDIGFQYKCHQRMQELRAKGTTILMVTHSSGSILQYADRCVVMKDGCITHDTSDVLEAILAYEKGMLTVSAPPHIDSHICKRHQAHALSIDQLRAIQISTRNESLYEKRFGTARAIIDQLTIHRSTFDADEIVFPSGTDLTFRFTILSSAVINNIVLGVSISTHQGVDLWGDNNLLAGSMFSLIAGENKIEYCVKLPIKAGDYMIHCGLASLEREDREELDQRRPMRKITFWSEREQVGFIYAPIKVIV